MAKKTTEEQINEIDDKIVKLQAKKKQILAKEAEKAARLDKKNKIPTKYGKPDQYIFWDYGTWVEKNCELPFSCPYSYSELKENLLLLLSLFKYNGDVSVTDDVYNEKYYTSGKNISAYGRLINYLIEQDVIAVPFKNPIYKTEMNDNLMALSLFAKEFNFKKEELNFDFSLIEEERVYSYDALVSIGFPVLYFDLPLESGEFKGTLLARQWDKKRPVLYCYFLTDENKYVKLSAWWKDNDASYKPKDCDISFKDDVANKTRWHCSFKENSNGNITWISAKPLFNA